MMTLTPLPALILLYSSFLFSPSPNKDEESVVSGASEAEDPSMSSWDRSVVLIVEDDGNGASEADEPSMSGSFGGPIQV